MLNSGGATISNSGLKEAHYLVAFPAVLHHPSTERFCVLLRSLPETVHLAVTLEMTAQNYTLLEKDVEKPGMFECTSFQVPAFVPTESGNKFPQRILMSEFSTEEEVAHVHVLIRKGDSVSFEGRKKVLVYNPYIRFIIQPDKPFYKPGDTVKFRIVRLDEEFKAIEDEIPLLELKDPSGNRIGQWVNVKPQQGIVDLSFPLASEAPLGIYTIQTGDFFPESKEFEVEEYILSNSEVSFELPPRVTASDEEIQIKVLGRYTYGKPVHGTVHLKLTQGALHYFAEEDEMPAVTKEYMGRTDKTGCASFSVNVTHFNISKAEYECAIKVYAELKEEGTDAVHVGKSAIPIVSITGEVEFINLNPYYKQGFPYTGKMAFTAAEAPVKNQSVYLTVDVQEVETHFPYVTDENGEVHFSLDTSKWQDLVSLRGRYTTLNVTPEVDEDVLRVRSEAFRWLHPFYSESNSFLEIQNVDGELPCEKDQEVLVDYILDRKELDPEAEHLDFYYLVISRGRIVTSGQKQVPVGQGDTLKGTFSLTLSTSMELAPSASLLLYAVFADGEVAADLEEFAIDKCFKHKVTLDFSAEEELPGSEVSLRIGAAPGALCSLQAVDKSVILRQNDTLTPSHILRLKLFTNTKVKKPVTCRPGISNATLYRIEGSDGPLPGNVLPEMEMSPRVSSSKTKKEEKAKPRTHFPETWLWNLIPVNERNCEKACEKGQVSVDVAESGDLEVMPCPNCQFTACLCEDEAKIFSWNVTATKLGHVNISVIAEAEENHELCGNQISVTPAQGRSDKVVKSVLVKDRVNDEISLTAYVAASLLELHLEKNGTMVDAALLCLKRNLSAVDGAYTKALLAYVFTLAGDMETRQQLLEELDKEADKTATDTRAYYLLALISTPEVSAEDLKRASQVVKALAKRQNPYGGFQSTQDTVVALQALSRYAALTYREIESLTALVTSSQGFRHEFHVDKQNRLLLQQASLPNVPGQYKVEVSGSGCVYLQATLRYNSLPQEDKKKVFALKVETSPKECNQTSEKHFDITLQASYTGERRTTNMVLIEVNLLSGFIPVKRLENKAHVRKVEFEPGKVILYLDEVLRSTQNYSLSVQQEVEVTGLKPAIVKIYDYYYPSVFGLLRDLLRHIFITPASVRPRAHCWLLPTAESVKSLQTRITAGTTIAINPLSRNIIEFLEKHPTVTLEIRMAQLFKQDEECNQEGLRNLLKNGVKIAIMNLPAFGTIPPIVSCKWHCSILSNKVKEEILYYRHPLHFAMEIIQQAEAQQTVPYPVDSIMAGKHKARRNDLRWKMDLEAFMSNFGESSHPRSTNLLYKVCWIRTGNTWKNFCKNDPPDHAEIIFLETECEKIKKWKSKPCYITWYLSWSPCGRCSCDILEFLDEHPKVTLDIRVARLYRHHDERNRQGLRDLDDNGVKISIMDYDGKLMSLQRVHIGWGTRDYAVDLLNNIGLAYKINNIYFYKASPVCEYYTNIKA
ncbi:hypothetical protein lerEdw1_020560 [Lerista edwardsae]|nr:hypothetical protein lerEdw1_020560 [Lerista edwardsae]